MTGFIVCGLGLIAVNATLVAAALWHYRRETVHDLDTPVTGWDSEHHHIATGRTAATIRLHPEDRP